MPAGGAQVELSLVAFQQPSTAFVAANTLPTVRHLKTYTKGSGANQISIAAFKTYAIAAGATTTIDLNDPTQIFDINGVALVFVRVRTIWVKHTSAGASASSSVRVNGTAANVMTDFTATLAQGAVAVIDNPDSAAGFLITNGTADKLVLVNQDGTNPATVDVAFTGAGS